jgi:hypothetical protein
VKVIIAGSRSISDIRHVEQAIAESGYEITEVVSGKARGVDTLGEQWAEAHGVPVKQFPADWNKHGKRAGFIRNEEMGRYADAAVICWDGSSNGSRHMRDWMLTLWKPVYVKVVQP